MGRVDLKQRGRAHETTKAHTNDYSYAPSTGLVAAYVGLGTQYIPAGNMRIDHACTTDLVLFRRDCTAVV